MKILLAYLCVPYMDHVCRLEDEMEIPLNSSYSGDHVDTGAWEHGLHASPASALPFTPETPGEPCPRFLNVFQH